jgi:hypothetical protein
MIATFILWVALQGIPIAPQAGGTLSGVLKHADGKPAVVSGRSGPSYYFDSDGMFEVIGLLPGTYRVVVQVAGYPDAIRELTADIEDIRLEIQIAK